MQRSAPGGRAFLVEGDIAARSARVIRDEVECPDLSPDGTRIAYKHPVAGPQRRWRLPRSGPSHNGVNLWTVPADGSGAPALFLAHAASPAIVRH